MEIELPLSSKLVEFACACTRGVLRHDSASQPVFRITSADGSAPGMRYRHLCATCGDSKWLPHIYPAIKNTYMSAHPAQYQISVDGEWSECSEGTYHELVRAGKSHEVRALHEEHVFYTTACLGARS